MNNMIWWKGASSRLFVLKLTRKTGRNNGTLKNNYFRILVRSWFEIASCPLQNAAIKGAVFLLVCWILFRQQHAQKVAFSPSTCYVYSNHRMILSCTLQTTLLRKIQGKMLPLHILSMSDMMHFSLPTKISFWPQNAFFANNAKKPPIFAQTPLSLRANPLRASSLLWNVCNFSDTFPTFP